MIIGGIIGGVVLIGIILIIVFSVGGKGPGPSPANPAFEHYNPYSTSGDITNTESGYEGELKGNFESSALFMH